MRNFAALLAMVMAHAFLRLSDALYRERKVAESDPQSPEQQDETAPTARTMSWELRVWDEARREAHRFQYQKLFD